MTMRPQTRQTSNEAGGNGTNAVLFIARALACSVEVFLHKSKTFGERYLGAQAAAAALLIFVFPMLMPTQHPTDLIGYLVAYLVMCAAARAGVLARKKRGELGPHSFYTGTPRGFARMREQSVK